MQVGQYRPSMERDRSQPITSALSSWTFQHWADSRAPELPHHFSPRKDGSKATLQ